MANFRKSFNFKNGVQVDTDNFIVDPIGRVGIGTTSPQDFLDIYGNDSGAVRVEGPVRVTGLTTVTHLYAGIGTIVNLTGTACSIGIGTFDQLQVGSSPPVSNLIGYGYTAWITDDGGVGLRTDAFVGIGTTTDTNYALLIGSVPTEAGVSGIGFTGGDIRATGVITATSFVGSLTGVAASATVLETARNFEITGDLEATAISFDGSQNVSFASTLSSSFDANTTGIITAATLSGVLTATSGYIGDATVKNLEQVAGGIATLLNVDGSYGDFDNLNVGVGTVKSLIVDNAPNTLTTLNVQNSYSLSDCTSEVSIGKSSSGGDQSVKIYYASGDKNLNITNYDLGDISLNLHGGTGTGNTGGFKVKYKNDIIFHSDYEGNVSIKKDDAADGYSLDVDGVTQTQGLKSVGIITVNTGVDSFELDASDPPLKVSSQLNITSGINTIKNLKVGILSATESDESLQIVLNEDVNLPVLQITQNSLRFGFDEDIIANPLSATFEETDVSIGGTQGGTLTANSVNAVIGVSTIISPIDFNRSGNCNAGNQTITGILTSYLHVGAAVTHPTLLQNGATITGMGINEIVVDNAPTGNGSGVNFFIQNVGVGHTHLSGNIDNYVNRRTTKLGITTVFDDFTIQDTESGTPLFNLDVNDATLNSESPKFLFLDKSVAIGIGTTTLAPYNTPSYSIIFDGRNPLLKANTSTGITGKLLIRRPSDQFAIDNGTASVGIISSFNVEGRPDPRIAFNGSDTDWNTTLGVPFFAYGANLDIDTTTSTMVFDGSLSIVPFPGKAANGYGDPANAGESYEYGGVIADNTGRTTDPNTDEAHADRLTMVGINTYLPRSVVDFSGASATMNSYMLIPSLSGSDIATMAALWEQNSGTGVAKAKRVTPNGVPGGALVYNTTTDKIQVRNTANSFRDLYSSVSSSIQTITSGDTEVVFNDVPAWANKITIVYLNVSHAHTPGNKHFRVQLGTSSSFITSNYDSESENYSAYMDIADGFVIWGATNVGTFSGHQTITKFDDATYVETHILSPGATSTNGISHGGGMLHSVSDTITRLRIDMHDGSTQFSGGKVKVLYEG